MIGITEIPPPKNQIEDILHAIRVCGGEIVIPEKNYKKFEKMFLSICGVKKDKFSGITILSLRSVPIYSKECNA